MLLPGGLLLAGGLRRDVAFKPPTGQLEVAVAEASGGASNLPMRVSLALSAALAHVGGSEPTIERVHSLCIADRQFLMHQLAVALGQGRQWLTGTCSACGERFDFALDLETLPVSPAGPGFPFVSLAVGGGTLRMRVPTGADQVSIAEIADESTALKTLVANLCLDAKGIELDQLTAAEVARIESVLEETSPGVVHRVQASCPACGQDQLVELDPYLVLRAPLARALDDVHVIASAYHWSEQEILALPQVRREFYLSRIDQARGMAH